MKPTIINFKAIQAASIVSSFERTRYAFDGVQINPLEKTVTATDGKMLVQVKCFEGDPEETVQGTNGFQHTDLNADPILVSGHNLTDSLKRLATGKNKDRTLVISSDDNRLNTRYIDPTNRTPQEYNDSVVDGSFPNFTPIMEPLQDSFTFLLNCEKLIQICKAAQVVAGKGACLKMDVKDVNTRVMFEVLAGKGESMDEVASMKGALMPVVME